MAANGVFKSLKWKNDEMLSLETNGPFKATKIWYEIISHLTTHVEIRDRKYKRRQYLLCFTGTNAVDVLLDYLMQNFNNISRFKASKLCQILLDQHVFELAKHDKPTQKILFEDSTTKFYKFTTHQLDTLLPIDTQGRQGYNDVISNPLELQKDIYAACSPVKALHGKDGHSADLDIDEVWKEVSLAKLLTIIDLPVLEFLHCYSVPITNSTIIANPIKCNINGYVDNWTSAALDCLDNPTENLNKKELFECVHQQFLGFTSPILPLHMFELFLAVLNVINNNIPTLALRAVQLSTILLPFFSRDQLRRLLKFMKLTYRPGCADNIKLNHFTKVIFHHKLLNESQAEVFVSFMLQWFPKIFHVPSDIKNDVTQRLVSLVQGIIPPIPGTLFCHSISSEDYVNQKQDYTNLKLKHLLITLMSITRKEKRVWLKRFSKNYPIIYKQYSGLAAIELSSDFLHLSKR